MRRCLPRTRRHAVRVEAERPVEIRDRPVVSAIAGKNAAAVDEGPGQVCPRQRAGADRPRAIVDGTVGIDQAPGAAAAFRGLLS